MLPLQIFQSLQTSLHSFALRISCSMNNTNPSASSTHTNNDGNATNETRDQLVTPMHEIQNQNGSNANVLIRETADHCSICLQDFGDDVVSVDFCIPPQGKTHSLCIECFPRYIQESVSRRGNSIICPVCKREYSYQYVNRLCIQHGLPEVGLPTELDFSLNTIRDDAINNISQFCQTNNIIFSNRMSLYLYNGFELPDFELARFFNYNSFHDTEDFNELNVQNIQRFVHFLRNIALRYDQFPRKSSMVIIGGIELLNQQIRDIINAFPFVSITISINNLDTREMPDIIPNDFEIRNIETKHLKINFTPYRVRDMIKIMSIIRFTSLNTLTFNNSIQSSDNFEDISEIIGANDTGFSFSARLQNLEIIDVNAQSIYYLLKFLLHERSNIYFDNLSISFMNSLREDALPKYDKINLNTLTNRNRPFNYYFDRKNGTCFSSSINIISQIIEPLQPIVIVIDHSTSWESDYNLPNTNIIPSIKFITDVTDFSGGGNGQINLQNIHIIQLYIESESLRCQNYNHLFTKFNIVETNLDILHLFENSYDLVYFRQLCTFINSFRDIKKVNLMFNDRNTGDVVNYNENLQSINNVKMVTISFFASSNGPIIEFINKINSLEVLCINNWKRSFEYAIKRWLSLNNNNIKTIVFCGCICDEEISSKFPRLIDKLCLKNNKLSSIIFTKYDKDFSRVVNDTESEDYADPNYYIGLESTGTSDTNYVRERTPEELLENRENVSTMIKTVNTIIRNEETL